MVKINLRKDEIVLCVLDYLKQTGLIQAMRALEHETGITTTNYGTDLDFLRGLILDAQFDDAESFVVPLANVDDFDADRVLFEIRRQRFLELVDGNEGEAAQHVLSTTLKQLESKCSRAEWHKLCYCLTLQSLADHPDYEHWTARCRLCATCIGIGNKRYKRTGGSTRCKLCPDPTTNKILLGVGFVVMFFGLSFLIYSTIKGEEQGTGKSGGKLSAIKKIALNFMQMISIVASLPLEWPDSIIVMFDTMGTISSAGTKLLIPDCELAHLRTSDAFYYKQIFYTFSIPLLIIGSFLSWSFIYIICAKRLKLEWIKIKHRMVLTMTLMIFLCYPMLVKLCLGMLKCPSIGNVKYLMKDLQEPCFTGRHSMYIIILTIPQLILYIIGLPLIAGLLILRNKERLDDPEFRIRYGLLYRGYDKGREWWELTVALRKVAAVSIGTFGSLIGIPEVQVGLALFVGLISIVMHLVGQPFGDPNGKSKQLHFMEFFSLVVIWFTNWGGLMLYILPSSPILPKILLTIFIILLVCTYNLIAFYIFGKALISAAIKKRKARLSILNGDTVVDDADNTDQVDVHDKTHVVPINNNALVEKVDDPEDDDQDDDQEEDEDFDHETSRRHKLRTSRHSAETIAEAHALHNEFHVHELALKAKNAKKQQKQRRATQNRLMARLQIRKTKALTRVPMFNKVPPESIESILECTTYRRCVMNDVLCTQSEIATEFYIIVTGQCAVSVRQINNKDATRRVGTLKELDFFGESALLDGEQTRNATVVAETEYVQVLMLSRMNFTMLLESGALSPDVMSTVIKEGERRVEATRKSLIQPSSMDSLEVPQEIADVI